MSVATSLPPGAGLLHRHPNEVDLARIVRALAHRARYRYVTPSVAAVEGGYLVRSACCSRKVDPDGGEIDVALLRWDEARRTWSLQRKDHKEGTWIEDSSFSRLTDMIARLNADPARLFWQ